MNIAANTHSNDPKTTAVVTAAIFHLAILCGGRLLLIWSVIESPTNLLMEMTDAETGRFAAAILASKRGVPSVSLTMLWSACKQYTSQARVNFQ